MMRRTVPRRLAMWPIQPCGASVRISLSTRDLRPRERRHFPRHGLSRFLSPARLQAKQPEDPPGLGSQRALPELPPWLPAEPATRQKLRSAKDGEPMREWTEQCSPRPDPAP